MADEPSYNVKGDGSTDDTVALNNAAADAKLKGKRLFMPNGTYNHSGVLDFDSISVFGSSDTTIHSTNTTGSNPDNAIILTGTNPSLDKVKVTTAWVGTRQSNTNSHAILVKDATGHTVKNCVVDGAAGSGIFVTNSSNGTTTNNTVSNTLADGFHHTDGSSNITVSGNYSLDTGDDGIAVVSYNSQDNINSDITITDNTVSGGSARGISVVGGQDITISNNNISNTDVSGIYIASEVSYDTYNVDSVVAQNNTIDNCNTDENAAHASILVNGRENYTTENIDLLSNTITNSNRHGISITSNTGNPDYTKTITIDGNSIKGNTSASNSGIGVKMYGVTDIDITNNTIEDFHQAAIYSDPSVTNGDCIITGNDMENLNLSNTASNDAITLLNGADSFDYVLVDDNTYTEGTYEVQYFLESSVGIPVDYRTNDTGGEPNNIGTEYE